MKLRSCFFFLSFPMASPKKKHLLLWQAYTPTALICQGPTSVVHKAKRKTDNVTVAIKISFPGGDGETNTPAEEAAFLRRVQHPYVVSLHECLAQENALVLEHCPTDLLLEMQGRRALPVRTFLSQILTAVRHMHLRGLVHCDLKPENVLIDPHRTVKVCDLGFMQKTGEDRRPSFRGTLEFLAPEYVWGARPHSPETDMWSVGCILYMLLTRRRLPFSPEDKMAVLTEECHIRLCFVESVFFFLDPPFPVRLPDTVSLPASLLEHPRSFRYFDTEEKSPLPWGKSLSTDGVDEDALDLLAKMWQFDPARRLTADQALAHRFLSKVSTCST